MLRNCPHSIVADTCWNCPADPCWIAEKGIEASVAAVIEIEVDAAVVREDKVAD